MRSSFFVLLLAFQFSTSGLQAQASRPIPPGMRQAEQADRKAEKSIPPPPSPIVAIDPAKLKHDAEELAALAQSIPPDVDKTAKGVLPQDLGHRLKRIEKLAKELRSQLTR